MLWARDAQSGVWRRCRRQGASFYRAARNAEARAGMRRSVKLSSCHHQTLGAWRAARFPESGRSIASSLQHRIPQPRVSLASRALLPRPSTWPTASDCPPRRPPTLLQASARAPLRSCPPRRARLARSPPRMQTGRAGQRAGGAAAAGDEDMQPRTKRQRRGGGGRGGTGGADDELASPFPGVGDLLVLLVLLQERLSLEVVHRDL